MINSYQKKSKAGPIILWAIAGIIFGAGIVLLILNLHANSDCSDFNPNHDADRNGNTDSDADTDTGRPADVHC